MFYLGVHDGSRPTVKPGLRVLDHAVTGSPLRGAGRSALASISLAAACRMRCVSSNNLFLTIAGLDSAASSFAMRPPRPSSCVL